MPSPACVRPCVCACKQASMHVCMYHIGIADGGMAVAWGIHLGRVAWLAFQRCRVYTHVRTHAFAHAYTHACAHVHAHVYAHVYTHTYTHMPTHMSRHTSTYMLIHMSMHIPMHMSGCSDAQTHIHLHVAEFSSGCRGTRLAHACGACLYTCAYRHVYKTCVKTRV